MNAATANPELLNTLLTQLSARIIADQTANDERFRTVHEDARRDRREVLTAIADLREELHGAFKQGFAALEAKVGEVCDRGGIEHAGFKDDIGELADTVTSLQKWREEETHKRAARVEVIENQKSAVSWWAQNGAAIAAIIIALVGLFKDDLPRVDVQWGGAGTQAR